MASGGLDLDGGCIDDDGGCIDDDGGRMVDDVGRVLDAPSLLDGGCIVPELPSPLPRGFAVGGPIPPMDAVFRTSFVIAAGFCRLFESDVK